ncbi:hypothetical protein QBC43DRAFT_351738 [Cladorrhinum sp. PSN259]|nr:hypothetical protein QBC43DRAFT_351738 [Cladorrhinum sp. PSN259]
MHLSNLALALAAFVATVAQTHTPAQATSSTQTTTDHPKDDENYTIVCRLDTPINQVSRASPLVKDCLGLRADVDRFPLNKTFSMQYKDHHTLFRHKSCAFGIDPEARWTRVDLLRTSILDILDENIPRFAWTFTDETEPRVGAKGRVMCNSGGKDWKGGSWGIYANSRNRDTLAILKKIIDTHDSTGDTPKSITEPDPAIDTNHGTLACTYDNYMDHVSAASPLVKDCQKMRDGIPNDKRFETKTRRRKGVEIARYGTCGFSLRAHDGTMVTNGSEIRRLIDESIHRFQKTFPGDAEPRVGVRGEILCGKNKIFSGDWGIYSQRQAVPAAEFIASTNTTELDQEIMQCSGDRGRLAFRPWMDWDMLSIAHCQKVRDMFDAGQKYVVTYRPNSPVRVARYITCGFFLRPRIGAVAMMGSEIRSIIDEMIRRRELHKWKGFVGAKGSLLCGEGKIEGGEWEVCTSPQGSATRGLEKAWMMGAK